MVKDGGSCCEDSPVLPLLPLKRYAQSGFRQLRIPCPGIRTPVVVRTRNQDSTAGLHLLYLELLARYVRRWPLLSLQWPFL